MIDFKVPDIFPDVMAHLDTAHLHCYQQERFIHAMKLILRQGIDVDTYLCHELKEILGTHEAAPLLRAITDSMAGSADIGRVFSFGVIGWLGTRRYSRQDLENGKFGYDRRGYYHMLLTALCYDQDIDSIMNVITEYDQMHIRDQRAIDHQCHTLLSQYRREWGNRILAGLNLALTEQQLANEIGA